MQRLQRARAYDLSNSTAFHALRTESLDHFNSRKADEVTDVMGRLRAGQEVPPGRQRPCPGQPLGLDLWGAGSITEIRIGKRMER